MENKKEVEKKQPSTANTAAVNVQAMRKVDGEEGGRSRF